MMSCVYWYHLFMMCLLASFIHGPKCLLASSIHDAMCLVTSLIHVLIGIISMMCVHLASFICDALFIGIIFMMSSVYWHHFFFNL